MHKLKVVLAFFLASINMASSANEVKGTVCLGQNLAKPADEHSRRLHLTIDDSQNIYFEQPYDGPRFIARDLDLHKEHLIRVHFDNQVVKSWTLNFSKLKGNSVLVWRSAGSWRIEKNEASSCK